jgi:hypothetical protein
MSLPELIQTLFCFSMLLIESANCLDRIDWAALLKTDLFLLVGEFDDQVGDLRLIKPYLFKKRIVLVSVNWFVHFLLL